jgi:hypothetical protein
MKIWIDKNTAAPNEKYISVESVAEAGLWVVLGETLGITASADNDINGVKKWKLDEINIISDEDIISDMRTWLKESNRSCRICVH